MGEKMRRSGNRNMLSARAGDCLRKRLQHVANADAGVAVWLWKLLDTTIRNEGGSHPPPKKEHHSILVGVLVDKMLLLPGSQTSLTHVPLRPLLMLWFSQHAVTDNPRPVHDAAVRVTVFTGTTKGWVIMQTSKATTKSDWHSSTSRWGEPKRVRQHIRLDKTD